MADQKALDEARVRLMANGMSGADMAWLEKLGWSDAAVPPIGSEAELADYRRREKILNAAIAHLTFAERAASPEGRLAATLGAKAADWADRDET